MTTLSAAKVKRRSPRLVLLSDAADWHARRLLAAADRLGFTTLCLPFNALSLTPQGCGVAFADDVADDDIAGCVVLARFMAADGLEGVTFRLSLLHALEEAGATVINGARAIERSVDKGLCSWLLRRRGLPTPPSWTCMARETAEAVVARERRYGHLHVLKPLFGARGQGLRLIGNEDRLPAASEVNGVWYLQRFVAGSDFPNSCCDWRVLVVAGEAVASMVRTNRGWVSNVGQGGRCRPARDAELEDLAVRAAAAVGAHYAGVDLLRAPGGDPYVLEVNAIPAWRGLQAVAATDLACRIVEGLRHGAAERRALAAAGGGRLP